MEQEEKEDTRTIAEKLLDPQFHEDCMLKAGLRAGSSRKRIGLTYQRVEGNPRGRRRISEIESHE